MRRIQSFTALLVLGFTGLLLSTPAAAMIQWNFSGGGQDVTGDAFTGTDGLTTATVTGWSNYLSGDVMNAATVRVWNGLGVQYPGEGNSPQHSTDNNGFYDMLLIQFNEEIALQTVGIGWWQTDYDISVLAYGGNNPPPVVDGVSTYSGLQGDGWNLLEHYHDGDIGSDRKVDINAGMVSSSWWLVGAYNPLVGNDQSWSTGNDYIKFNLLAGKLVDTPPGVPEPGLLLLMSLGVAVFGFSRRGLPA